MYSQPCEKVGSYVGRSERFPGEIDGLKDSDGRETGFTSGVILYTLATGTSPVIVSPKAEAAAVATQANGVRW